MIRNVHQILFSADPDARPEGYTLKATRSVERVFADHDYHLWRLEEAERFVEEHCSGEVLQAFHALKPYSFKADLFKFCLLKVLGGWVVDLGVRMLKSPIPSNAGHKDPNLVVFRSSGQWDPAWNCSLALLYASPGLPVFDTAMQRVASNCRNRYYGDSPLMPTMATFGHALAQHELHEGVQIGNVVSVRWRSYKRGFRLGGVGLVAARKPPRAKAGNISNLGVTGTNNYVHLWKARDIYQGLEGG